MTKDAAYSARQEFPSQKGEAHPVWCFERYGQSVTYLDDRRAVYIGGEHEDSYDPDFHIYNDVIVIHPDKSIDIYGYPKDVFPATDNHTATLVGGQIIIIGNLGYVEERMEDQTPVFSLDIETFAISRIEASGDLPGWISGHMAKLSQSGDAITLSEGKFYNSGFENIDAWQLHLSDWHWQRLTKKKWIRWHMRRKDGLTNHLFEVRQAVWGYDFCQKGDDYGCEMYKQFQVQLVQALGVMPEIKDVGKLYQPGIVHEKLENDAENPIYAIMVDGVKVRYLEGMYAIEVTVEGQLPPDIIGHLKQDLFQKLSALENTEIVIKDIS